MSLDEILDYEWEFKDTNARSIRQYLHSLLITLWDENEGFSSKRPFGNSGWDYDLLTPLVVMGAIKGKFIEEDGLYEVDAHAGRILIVNLIQHIFKKP